MVLSDHNETAEHVHTCVDGSRFFACRVRQFLTLGALGKRDQNYPDEFLRRQVEFLSCLISSGDERCTYELRLISKPDLEIYTLGRIGLALVCRLENADSREVESFAKNIFRLLQACFGEYDFELVQAEDLPLLLEPFEVRHVASISRRWGWNSLETMTGYVKTPQRLGFAASALGPSAAPELGRVFHVFPFLPTFAPHDSLFKLMLLQADPSILSCRLRPTTLRPTEARFLEEQIFRCESYAQVGLGQVPDDLSLLRPTLQQHARLQQQFLTRMLHSLKDGGALLTIEISSPSTIPQPVVDVVGHLVSRPVGVGPHGTGENLGDYLSGGYQVYRHDGEAVPSSACLDITPENPPGIPSGMERLPYLFGASEAAAAFRFPLPCSDALPGVPTRRFRQMPPPPSLPKEGLEIAASLVGDHYQSVLVAAEDRIRHIYIVGQTGTGKTTMLKSMIGSDLKSDRGLCVIDPHGDLFRWALAQIPDERMDDVVLIDPSDKEFPVGLNMLECPDDSQRHFLVQEMTGIVSRITQDEHGQAAQEWMGPIFLQHVRMNLLLVMSDLETPGTLLDFYDVFVEKDGWKRWLPLKTDDPQLEKWVDQVLPRTDYFKSSEGAVFGGYFTSKFEQFVFDPALRNIFGQRHSTINFRELMDQGKILLVNLAKGELSDMCSRFLGMVLLAKLQAAAMGRVRVPLEQRRPFFVYVDEFQNIATQGFISMLSEGRKFGLGLVLANQFVSQLEDRRIVESIFGNVGTLISFRVGQPDAEVLEKYFYPVFSRSDLISLPNWHSVMNTLVNGQTVQPFSIETKLILSEYDYRRAESARAQSRRKYGTMADKKG